MLGWVVSEQGLKSYCGPRSATATHLAPQPKDYSSPCAPTKSKGAYPPGCARATPANTIAPTLKPALSAHLPGQRRPTPLPHHRELYSTNYITV